MMNIAQCPDCGGSGKIIEKPCETCHGRGTIQKTRTIEVSIPRGVEDGQFLRIAGEGEPGENQGPPGDLYAVVHIKKHDIFERQGADLYSTAVIGLVTALLGSEINVPDHHRNRITENSPRVPRVIPSSGSGSRVCHSLIPITAGISS